MEGKQYTDRVKNYVSGRPSKVLIRRLREDFKIKKTAYFMTSGKKVGGPLTKTKFQKKIWTNTDRG